MTLVETLVAIAILGVSATAFVTALSTGSIATSTQDERTIAEGLAQSQIEFIKSQTYDATGVSYSAITCPTGYSVSVNANSAIYSNNNIQKITISVSHNSNVVLTLEDYKVNH